MTWNPDRGFNIPPPAVESPQEKLQSLFEKIDPTSLTTLTTIQTLESELEQTRLWYQDAVELFDTKASKKCEDMFAMVREYAQKGLKSLDAETSSNSLALVWFALQGFYSSVANESGKPGYQSDPDLLSPFEISKGEYAAFSHDKKSVYVASAEGSQKVEKLRELPTDPHRWQESPAFKALDASDSIRKTGTPVAERLPNSFKRDPSLLQDYTLLLQAATRTALESALQIQLSSLSIREQAELLLYARTNTLEEFVQLQTFTTRYGVDGARTFLTNAYSPDMSKRILSFAASHESVVVVNILHTYASILDAAEVFAHSMSRVDGVDQHIAQLSDGLFESFIHRSAHLFSATESISIEQLTHAFKGIELLSGMLADASLQEKYTFTPDAARTKGDNYLFTIESKDGAERYDLKVFVRPRAEVAQRSAKRGNDALEQTLQARINIELSLDNLPLEHPLRKAFYNKTTFTRDNKTVESSVIRFGLDLDDAYDPPRLSFDMGRDARAGQTQTRSGDVLGRVLEQAAPSGHHLTESFDPALSNPDTFARIAEGFKQYLEGVASAEVRRAA